MTTDVVAATRLSSDAIWSRLTTEIDPSQRRALLLYVHVPYCSSKCGFCDWVKEIPVVQLRAGGAVRQRYVSALAAQIHHHGPRLMETGFEPRLVYWGGGTPTRLDAEEMAVIGHALRDAFDLRGIEEYTIECSPETVTRDKMETLRAIGATRVSIGAQSFDEAELRRAGRSHGAAQIGEALAHARAAGFADANIDLIAAFPGQRLEMLRDSVRRTIDLEPTHVTVYVYRATDGTVMAEQVRRGHRQAGDYDVMLASYSAARDLLAASGYQEYAIGYFRRQTHRPCRADQFYFSIEGDYFGFGSGAHSIVAHHFVENAATAQDAFIADPSSFSNCERFSRTDLSRLFTSLSQTLWIGEGLSFARFEHLYGLPFDAIARHPQVRAFMQYYEQCGAIFERTETHLKVTPETMVPAYIRALSLYGTQNEGRSLARAAERSARAR